MKNKLGSAMKLLMYLGEINEVFIEEAETTIFPSKKKSSPSVLKYGGIAAGVVGVCASAYFLNKLRTGKKATVVIAAG